jgi:hypothetical protein
VTVPEKLIRSSAGVEDCEQEIKIKDTRLKIKALSSANDLMTLIIKDARLIMKLVYLG